MKSSIICLLASYKLSRKQVLGQIQKLTRIILLGKKTTFLFSSLLNYVHKLT